MNIYKFFHSTCTHYFNRFTLIEREGKLKNSISAFCRDHNENTARLVYEAFLHTYRIPGLEEIVEAMQNFETASSKLIPKQRDHYIHTVNVFLLGLALYEHNEVVRKAVEKTMDYPDRYPEISEEFLYRWGMASLFHDVGYPLEIAYKTIHEFLSMLMEPTIQYDNEDIVKGGTMHNIHNPVAVLNFLNIDNLLNINMLPPDEKFEDEFYDKYPVLKIDLPDDIFVAIADNISDNLGFASQDISAKLRESLKSGLTKGLVDHGLYSSIILLKWVNQAFLKTGWNPAYFYFPVVDSATAILLHNAYNYIFQMPPFNLKPLAIGEHPLGFLLILCDRIQENDRVSYGYVPKGIEFTSSSLEINNDHLILHLFISPEANKSEAILKAKKIKNSVCKSIDIYDVFERFDIEIQEEVLHTH